MAYGMDSQSLVVWVLALTVTMPIVHATDVTVRDALRLARVVVLEEMEPNAKLPRLVLDPNSTASFPGFFIIEAELDNPQGSVIFNHYAVDRRTGDVWGAVICKEYVSQKLRKAQRSLRHRIGLSDERYRSLRRPGPFCSGA
jgi:hypothetical protein